MLLIIPQTRYFCLRIIFLTYREFFMKESIMIVDDDRDDIDIFIEAVHELDPSINCLSANNGLAGLNLINSSKQKPDYIFVDINMPKISGKQFIADIRKNALFDNIKLVVYSTSKPTNDDLYGADEFISKPTSQEELCSAIAKVMDKQYHGIHDSI
jgi:CheY-like chemotaxis protein